MKIVAAESDRGKRLDSLLREHLPSESRSRLQDWIRRGSVRVNGALAKPAQSVHGGERIEVEPIEPPPLNAQAENLPLDVLYRDSDLIVVNKAAGMAVHPGAGLGGGTLVNALLHHFGELSQAGGVERPGIVHRLDRYTSGVLVVARNDPAHRDLAAQFAQRQIIKNYLTAVHGDVTKETGRIEKPIARDPARRDRMTTRVPSGRAAWSEYRVLERFRQHTYLEVRLGTGRTHQIRVHLASIGHPVVGDRLYGAPRSDLGRYFLHAHRIALRHPRTSEPLEFVAPLAPELVAWLAHAGHSESEILLASGKSLSRLH